MYFDYAISIERASTLETPLQVPETLAAGSETVAAELGDMAESLLPKRNVGVAPTATYRGRRPSTSGILLE
jgi:hypothetical protein